jgi:hypothetical protein
MYSTRIPLELHPNPVQEEFKWSSGKVRGNRGVKNWSLQRITADP